MYSCRPRVFLDRKCLRSGERFDQAFMEAMLSSHVIVPHVSHACLVRMQRLRADSPIDNVLLEWTCALELQLQRPVQPLSRLGMRGACS